MATVRVGRRAGGLKPVWLVVLISLWLACLPNFALWRELLAIGALKGLGGWGFGLAMGVIVAAATAVVLGLLAWRWTLKPAAVFLLLAAAGGAYFMGVYRIVIDASMLTNVLQTDLRETRDLLNWRLLAVMVLLGLLPAWWVWRVPVHYGRWPQRLLRNLGLVIGAAAVLVATVMAAFAPLSSTMRNHKQLRYLINPLNSVYALGELAAQPFKRDERSLAPLGLDARLVASAAPGARPPLLVLVLGETARAASFGLNGYGRDTTPELTKLPVINWRNATSCGTSTAASVPCMFSHLEREAFNSRRVNHENLLDVAQRAGLAVLWLDNQAGCKGVCDRVAHASTADKPDPKLCDGEECLDEVLLQGLDARLAALPAERRARGVLLVMHQMGSHGPAYYKRSPPAFKRFTPECTTNVLQDCSREQLLNAYDNTIAYTDHFLAMTMAWLGQQQSQFDAAMLYVSDHGESLGENNLYLHGLPFAVAPDVQKRVPWITWLSPGFTASHGLDAACLKGRADAPVSHDHLFHSVLGLMSVQTSVYQGALDAYAPCRGH
jgi:lipid A ethanolaminephosphotransferase